MISINKYLFEQDNVPVPQTVLDARANSLAAMRAKLKAAGQGSLAPGAAPVQNVVVPVTSAVRNDNTPLAGMATNVVKKISGPSSVDSGTWGNIAGKLASKTVQSVTN